MSHLSSQQVADLSGLTKRQIQRILNRGTPDFGAVRTSGGHWQIPDTVKLRRWCRKHERWQRDERKVKVRLNARDKSAGIVTIEGVSMSFDLWQRKMASIIPTWHAGQIDRALELLDGPARLHAQLLAMRQRIDEDGAGGAS